MHKCNIKIIVLYWSRITCKNSQAQRIFSRGILGQFDRYIHCCLVCYSSSESKLNAQGDRGCDLYHHFFLSGSTRSSLLSLQWSSGIVREVWTMKWTVEYDRALVHEKGPSTLIVPTVWRWKVRDARMKVVLISNLFSLHFHDQK